MAKFNFLDRDKRQKQKTPKPKTKSVKQLANETEKDQAARLGGKRMPCSGAIDGMKGDYVVGDFLFDSKESSTVAVNLTTKDFTKITREANQAGKHPALTIKLSILPNTVSKEWVAVPIDVFAEMLEKNGL